MIEIDFTPGPMARLLDYVIENYLNIEGFCPNTRLSVSRQECVECNHQRYFGGGAPIYGCENFRKVYLMRFLISHTKQTSDLIEKTIISDLANNAALSAISFGGGPGVEALALMAQLSNFDANYELLFDNIDLERSWEPIYRDLVQAFSEWVKNVRITPLFSHIDVTGSFKAPEFDIVFVPWILSELGANDRQSVLSKARDLCQSARYVVVTDRPESDLIERISGSITSIQDWELIKFEPEFNGWCGIHFPDDLRGEFQAQVNYNTVYWVLKKSEAPDIPF